MADPDAETVKLWLGVHGAIEQGKGVDLQGSVQRAPIPADLVGTKDVMRLGRGIGRAVGEAALPTIGGLAGGAVGLATGGPVGAGLGIVGGGAAGEALNPAAFRMLGLEPPASMTGSRPLDALMTGVTGLAGEGVGRGISRAVSAATRPARVAPAPGAATLRQRFLEIGVEPKMSDFAPNVSTLERSVAQSPSGGPIIREKAERQAAQLSSAAREFLDTVAPAAAGERMVAGTRASDAIGRQVTRTQALENHLWEQMGQIATDLPVDIVGLKRMANNVLLDQQRRLAAQRNGTLVRQAEEILAHGDTVPWQTVDAWRRGFGEAANPEQLIADVPRGAARALYGAALTDMEQSAAAATHVPGIGQAYQHVRQFSEHRRAIFRDHEAARILETDPEKVVSLLKAGGGPTAIQRAREAILGSPELGLVQPAAGDVTAWNYVRRHILEGVLTQATDANYRGLANPVIVGSRLEKTLDRFGRDSMNELLSATERRALENITEVAKALRTSERVGALPFTSSTPQGLSFLDMMRSPGAMVGGAVGYLAGDASGAAAGAAAGGWMSLVLTPWGAARLLTNSRAAEIVASPNFAALARIGQQGAQAATQGTKALTQLGAILGEQGYGRSQ